MVICLEQGADLHMAQLMPLPLTVCCFSKIQIGFTFLVPAHLGSPGKGLLNECVCVFTFLQSAVNALCLHFKHRVYVKVQGWSVIPLRRRLMYFCNPNVLVVISKGIWPIELSAKSFGS